VISDSIFVDVLVRHLLARDPGDKIKRLQNRYRIFPATAQIVNLADPRLTDELTQEARHIERMNVISNLFPFVAKDLLGFSFQIALDQVTEEPVQFDAGVVWSGSTAAAETTGRHLEVAAILLHHHVRRHFRCPEQRMGALIDRKTLFDSSGEFRVGVIPTGLFFDQVQTIRSIAVNLVGRHMDKRGLRAPLVRCLEQIEGAARVHIEIIKGPRSRQIMTGLSGCMNDRVRPDLLNQT
jgi:hypothetical protein